MTLRQLLAKMVSEGDLDQDVHVRVVTRREGTGSVKSAKLIPVDRFCRMNLNVWNEGNFIVIEQSDLDNAKEDMA